MRKVLTKMCRIDYLSFGSRYCTLEIFNLTRSLSVHFFTAQQIVAPRIDKYFKCTPCRMFKQLKIYKVIIKTNDSCTITIDYKM